MLDLDALERAFDQAEEIPFVRMPTLRKVVAELRASRKVADAAFVYLNATERERVVVYPEVRELRAALSGLSSINDRRESEGDDK